MSEPRRLGEVIRKEVLPPLLAAKYSGARLSLKRLMVGDGLLPSYAQTQLDAMTDAEVTDELARRFRKLRYPAASED